MKSLIIIPTYNERENLEGLVQSIIGLEGGFDILIIDDNSPDGTGEIARNLSARYSQIHSMHRVKKMGLGTAYVEGFKYALSRDYDYIFTMDADFSHDPKYLPEFLEKLKDYQVVIGSRYVKGGGVVNWPIRRRMLSWFGNFYARAITGLKLRDCTSGYIAFKREVLDSIHIETLHSKGYAFAIETKYRSKNNGYKIIEIPITFVDRERGKSKISKSVMFEAAFLVWKFRFKNIPKWNLVLIGIFVFAFLIRMWGIGNPLLDFHSWRQTFTAMMARNFYLNGMNILQPRVDLLPGIVEVEFQLYPFIVAILYKIFGFHEWLGRFVSVIFGMGTMFFLYLLIRKYFKKSIAIIAISFFSILPMMVYYSRTFMPESAMLFFSVSGLYLFTEWLREERWNNFFLASLCLTCAFLVKIPTLYMLFPILFLSFSKYGKNIYKRWELYLFMFMVLLPPFLWYYYSHQVFLGQVGGVSMWDVGSDKWFNLELLGSSEFYKKIFITRLGELMFAYSGYLFLLYGLFMKVKRREEYLFHIWFFGIVLYFFVVAKGNRVHEYYQLPIILPGVVFIAKALDKNLARICNNPSSWYRDVLTWVIVFLVLIVPPYSFIKLSKRLKIDESYKIVAEETKKISNPDDMLLVSDEHGVEILYYSGRKGWRTRDKSFSPSRLEVIREEGAGYFVTRDKNFNTQNNTLYNYLLKHYSLAKNGEIGFIFDLER